MGQDVLKLGESYLAEDPTDWESLADDLRFRRVQILLLREILLELRKLSFFAVGKEYCGQADQGQGHAEEYEE